MAASSTSVPGPASHKIREIQDKVELLQTSVSHVTTLAMFDSQQIHISALQSNVDDVMNSNNKLFGQIAELQNQVDLQQQQINNYQSTLEIAQEEIQKFHQYKTSRATWESSIMEHIQSLEDKPSYMSYKPPEIFQSELGYKSTSASTLMAEQCPIPNIMMTPPLQNTGKRFKVGVLPKVDRQGNIHTFLRLYKMAKVGAPDTEKTYLIINLLDPMSRDIIMPSLPVGNITYQDARRPF
ncbi:hypothetical protein DSO57_1027040 [Entomophthora muscae]|uniref:Uncharacterized protein n=1 Tax=Entomophthora muscae TaxID=34485 RepID=A0ACC2UAZ4_9FUNG|nr:hypothetical protein DSO57_1027040 [Entomophthora muscae]